MSTDMTLQKWESFIMGSMGKFLIFLSEPTEILFLDIYLKLILFSILFFRGQMPPNPHYGHAFSYIR